MKVRDWLSAPCFHGQFNQLFAIANGNVSTFVKNFILTSSILSVLAIVATASVPLAEPELPHTGTDNGAVDFASRDVNRLTGNIMLIIARKSPWVNILEGGVLENVSETVRSVVSERPVLGQSLTKPVFIDDPNQCGLTGPQAQVGSTEFFEKLQTLRGIGPKVCVKTTRTAFKGSYTAAEDGLRKNLVQLNNADVRAQIVYLSGCKLIVNSTLGGFFSMFNGDTNAVATPFVPVLPDSQLNFSLLKYARNYMKETLLVEGWEGDENEPIFKLIASQDQIEFLRTDMDIKLDQRALTTGQFKAGEKFITGYTWEGPYRGFAFGMDPQPLRYDYLDANGQPIFIEPEIATSVTNGVGARTNPAWARARFEIGVLMGRESFKRRVPPNWTGEGSFKWPAQLVQGELEFVVIRDNQQNVFADYGYHIYQIMRSYQPVRPHHALAIGFKRCDQSFNLSPCADYPNFSSTSAI